MTLNVTRTQTYLFPPARRGEAGTCYSAGTQICLNCPLPPSTCNHSGGDDSAIKHRQAAPICLVDYAIWRLAAVAMPAQARRVGDDVARQTLGKGLSEKAFRRAVDVWADRLEFMQQLGERNAKSQD